jgi:hypothetical protein
MNNVLLMWVVLATFGAPRSVHKADEPVKTCYFKEEVSKIYVEDVAHCTLVCYEVAESTANLLNFPPAAAQSYLKVVFEMCASRCGIKL